MVPRFVIDDFLAQKRLAIAGVSRDPKKGFGNIARKELSGKGYEITLVHPHAASIDDAPCARDLADVAGRVDALLLVTPPAETEKLVARAAEVGIKRIWMQQGAESDRAIKLCEEHGIAVVHHECILMFAEPAQFFHRAHRWVRSVTGALPQ